jgi:hypothetical protein
LTSRAAQAEAPRENVSVADFTKHLQDSDTSDFLLTPQDSHGALVSSESDVKLIDDGAESLIMHDDEESLNPSVSTWVRDAEDIALEDLGDNSMDATSALPDIADQSADATVSEPPPTTEPKLTSAQSVESVPAAIDTPETGNFSETISTGDVPSSSSESVAEVTKSPRVSEQIANLASYYTRPFANPFSQAIEASKEVRVVHS